MKKYVLYVHRFFILLTDFANAYTIYYVVKKQRGHNERTKHGRCGALAFVWDVGYLTAIPVIIFAFGGRYLDMRYDASPWFLLCGLCISVLLSAYLVYKRMQRFL